MHGCSSVVTERGGLEKVVVTERGGLEKVVVTERGGGCFDPHKTGWWLTALFYFIFSCSLCRGNCAWIVG